MVKGLYFSLSFNWEPERRSILEISERMICLFQDLASFDDRFIFPKYLSRNNKEIELNINTADSSNLFAVQFLTSVEKDIIEHDKNDNISVDFKRDFGFTGSFSFGDNGIILSGRLGSCNAEGLSFSFPKGFEEPISWYLKLLKVCVNNTTSFFGAMQLKTIEITRKINDLKYPIGIVTYYGNSLSLDVSKCLDDIEVEDSENGIYVILTQSAVTANKEAFELFKNKLLELNTSIGKFDSKFLRTPPYPA